MLHQITATPKLYIGVDIHKKTWAVHLRTDISDHRGMTMPPDPQKLQAYVDHHFADHQVFLTYESGCCGFSAARYFLELGWQVIVVNPSDIPRIQKLQFQKTDRIDARMLSRCLQQQQLKAIYIPTEAQDNSRF